MLYKILLKILWLGFRLNLTFRFFFKYFVLLKLSSIFFDYYLGFYPKIFNDQGLKLQFQYVYDYIFYNYYFYFFGIYFLLLLLFFYLLFLWPYFFEIRKTRDHLNFKEIVFNNKKKPINFKESLLKNIEINIKTKLDGDLKNKNIKKNIYIRLKAHNNFIKKIFKN